jgi:sec-independent protein translocase protein TatA
MVPVLALLGPAELMFFGVIVLLLFGSRLPSVMRSIGQSVTSFKTGLNDDDEHAAGDTLDEKKK